ncbi:MAG: 30S ribosome-binding factor RbfA [Phycisphaerae bacterium]|nr:30S ribosome-binding factor RbfA [Phycisphaerae bacterium]
MKSFRPERVGHLIREVVSDAISNRLNDPRIGSMASVTRVEVTADLEHAKVWVSIMGSEADQRRTLAGLKSATGFIQGLVAREVQIRSCPRLSFKLDESIKKGEAVLRIIEETMAEYAPKDAAGAGADDDDADDDDAVEHDSDDNDDVDIDDDDNVKND